MDVGRQMKNIQYEIFLSYATTVEKNNIISDNKRKSSKHKDHCFEKVNICKINFLKYAGNLH